MGSVFEKPTGAKHASCRKLDPLQGTEGCAGKTVCPLPLGQQGARGLAGLVVDLDTGALCGRVSQPHPLHALSLVPTVL